MAAWSPGLAALDAGLRAADRRKAAPGRRFDGTLRRHRLAAQQSVDAGRGHRGLTPGRPGLPGRRRRRHRCGLLARAPGDVPDCRLRDDQFPAPQRRSDDPLRRLERLLPEPQGRQRSPAARSKESRSTPPNWAPGSDKVQPSLAKNYGYVVLTNELRSVQYFNRSPRAFAVATKVFARTSGGPARPAADPHQRRVLDRPDAEGADRPQRRPATAVDQRRHGGSHRRRRPGRRRARIVRDGAAENVEARKGVLLAAGGFGHNRRDASPVQRRSAQRGKWSIANAGDTGEVLQTAMRLGAKTDLLDEAWWLPSVFIANGGAAAASLGSGRQRPGAIYVDSGRPPVLQRVELLRGSRQGDVRQQGGAVLDDLRRRLRAQLRRRYQPAVKNREHLPPELIESGAVKRAETARRPRPPDRPARRASWSRTIERFNKFAAKGLDPDFGRGQSAYNDCLGDPGYRPNAAVGPLDRAPYYATRVLPADVGTCGGVITNEHAQVLDEQDRVIDGPLRDRQHHRHGHGPNLSRAPVRASRAPWCSATSPPGTPPAARSPAR